MDVRPLCLVFALAGCEVAAEPSAPEVDAEFAARTIPDQIRILRTHDRLLKAELDAAVARIDALEAAVFDVDPATGAKVSKVDALTIKQSDSVLAIEKIEIAVEKVERALFDLDPATGDPVDRIAAIKIEIGAAGYAVAELDDAVFETDASGARVNKVEALTIKQKMVEDTVGELCASHGYPVKWEGPEFDCARALSGDLAQVVSDAATLADELALLTGDTCLIGDVVAALAAGTPDDVSAAYRSWAAGGAVCSTSTP